ncbi:hypothetical protein N0V92_002670 [Colletotrichum tropicale]|nr:hypothetical protein N0V92_002670 [Colletotrichum tropicale]
MLAVLPYIRSFRNLKSFYLGIADFFFNEHVADVFGGPEAAVNLRGALLYTLFFCIAGEWTEQEHAKLLNFITYHKEPEDNMTHVEWTLPDAEPTGRDDDDEFDDEDDAFQRWIERTFGEEKKKPTLRNRPPEAELLQDPLWQSWETLLGPALPLQTLSIGGLAHSDDLTVFNTVAFKKIASLKSLTKLKIFVSPGADHCYLDSGTRKFRSASPMLHCLPKTLLCPSIADNLRVLSLYGPDNFGWYPPLDLRRINCQGKSPLDAGLPNLRVLALGGFAFTQAWQVEWIASLGKGSGGSGLEELYLDNCNVITEARKFRLQTGETTIGRDASGQVIQVNNSEFPDTESIDKKTGSHRVRYKLRWHHILNSWRQSMTALKVFIMGCGDHNDTCLQSVIEANYPDQLPIRSDHILDRRFSRHGQRAFLNYNAPQPPFNNSNPAQHTNQSWRGWGAGLPGRDKRYYKKKNRPEAPQYKHGVGMLVDCASQHPWLNGDPSLSYTKFDGGIDYYPWTKTYNDEPRSRTSAAMGAEEPDTVKEDKKAYEMLLEFIRTKAT